MPFVTGPAAKSSFIPCLREFALSICNAMECGETLMPLALLDFAIGLL